MAISVHFNLHLKHLLNAYAFRVDSFTNKLIKVCEAGNRPVQWFTLAALERRQWDYNQNLNIYRVGNLIEAQENIVIKHALFPFVTSLTNNPLSPKKNPNSEQGVL